MRVMWLGGHEGGGAGGGREGQDTLSQLHKECMKVLHNTPLVTI